jgi:hypothetical protein
MHSQAPPAWALTRVLDAAFCSGLAFMKNAHRRESLRCSPGTLSRKAASTLIDRPDETLGRNGARTSLRSKSSLIASRLPESLATRRASCWLPILHGFLERWPCTSSDLSCGMEFRGIEGKDREKRIRGRSEFECAHEGQRRFFSKRG